MTPYPSAYAPALTVPGTNLSTHFHFHLGLDPAGSFAYYQDDDSELYWTNANESNWARLHANTCGPFGPSRPSLWLESSQSWNEGLFLVDFDRMPEPAYGLAATFAAHGEFGEISFLEGRNLNEYNAITASR